MSKKGGYQIVSLKQPVDVSKLELLNGKAVLLTDINIGGVDKKDVFAQVEKVVAEDVTTYVIKGVYGYDLTIDSDGVITWKAHESSLENVVDAQGHKRFIEGDITLGTGAEEGITKTYGKWSLSGTHLLIVLGLSIPNETAIVAGGKAVLEGIPKWILDKIYPLFASSIIDSKVVNLYGDDYSTQTLATYLIKESTRLVINTGAVTLTADRNARISYDLLIDNAQE